MIIDEEKKYALTKYFGRTGNKNIKESDHNTMILELDINWKSKVFEPKERIEIYNFKQPEHSRTYIFRK